MHITARYPRTILGTCCVPWDENNALDEEIFRNGIRLLLAHGLQNLYIFGTAGEGYAVSENQFDEIARIFCQEMRSSGAEPMIGLITLSLRGLIERIERAIEFGARDFQISLPAWGALDNIELFTYFREVCGRFPQCRFLHYNLLRVKRLVTPIEYSRLAQEHPNLVATKQGTSDTLLIGDLLKKAPQLRHFLTEPGFAYGSLLGECGLLISIASTNLGRAREYFAAGAECDIEKLMAMQSELMEMRSRLLDTVGDSAHMDGAYDKIFARLYDPRFPLRMLPPYRGVKEEQFAEYKEFVAEKFPQWMPEKP